MSDALEKTDDLAPPGQAPGPPPPPAEPPLFDASAEVGKVVHFGGAQAPPPPPPPAPDTPPPRRRGRPPEPNSKRSKAANKANETRQAQAQGQQQQQQRAHGFQPRPPVDRTADAREFNLLFFGISVAFLGERSAPTVEERERCDAALAEYLKLHPELKPRPELALLIAYGGWLGNRLASEPTVRERAAAVWQRSRGLLAGVLDKMRRKKAPA